MLTSVIRRGRFQDSLISPKDMVKLNFDQLKIDKPVVSIFASGMSIEDLTPEDISLLKEKTFTYGTNCFHLKFTPRLLMWSDHNQTDFIGSWFEKEGKKCLLATHENAFRRGKPAPPIYHNIDFWFNKQPPPTGYGLDGNFTAYWAVQLILKFHPDKTILCFGFDGYNPIPPILKDGMSVTHWYDLYTDYFMKDRVKPYLAKPNAQFLADERWTKSLTHFKNLILTRATKEPEVFKNVYNCNPGSMMVGFQKTDNFRKFLI